MQNLSKLFGMKYIIDPSERSVLVLFSIFFTAKKLRDRFKETTPTTLCTLLPERDHQEVSNCLKRTDVTLERGKKVNVTSQKIRLVIRSAHCMLGQGQLAYKQFVHAKVCVDSRQSLYTCCH